MVCTWVSWKSLRLRWYSYWRCMHPQKSFLLLMNMCCILQNWPASLSMTCFQWWSCWFSWSLQSRWGKMVSTWHAVTQRTGLWTPEIILGLGCIHGWHSWVNTSWVYTICQDLSEESVQARLPTILSQAMILLHRSSTCFQRELSEWIISHQSKWAVHK